MNSVPGECALAAALCIGIVLFGAAGRAVGLRRLKGITGSQPGQRAIETAVLGLMGLLLAFTFNGAADRFDGRKALVIEETNAIGTAYLRLDLLPESDRRVVQGLFRRYLDSRIETYRRLPDLAAALRELPGSKALQAEIWRRAVAASRHAPIPARVLLPALNTMFDIATTRVANTQIHPPRVVFALLNGVALLSALLVGYALADGETSGWPHLVVFALIVAITIFVIHDLEYPRIGLFRIDGAERLLVNLRSSLGP